VARSPSKQVRAARLTPKARSFQCEGAPSTEGLTPPTLSPVATPRAGSYRRGRPGRSSQRRPGRHRRSPPTSTNVRGRTRTYTNVRGRSRLADLDRPGDARRGPSSHQSHVHERPRTTTNVRGQSLSPQAKAPSLTLTADSITDAQTGRPIQADVYVNDALLFEGVTHFQVTIPLDGSAEIHVTAPGYKPWGIRPRGEGTDKTLSGPIRLTPE
jgi:hypothetical protein